MNKEGQIIPNFLVFEGGDGSGTTTQLNMLAEQLKKHGKKEFFPTFEPTDRQIGKLIRCALKKEVEIEPQTLAFLFAADRNEHLYAPDGILAHVNNGEIVISDRFVLSSLVYQGIECGEELPILLNSRFGIPELTIFLDIDPKIAMERMKGRTSLEIYEYGEFQEKVREKYKAIIHEYRACGARVEIIDASQSAQDVFSRVWSIVLEMPIFN